MFPITAPGGVFTDLCVPALNLGKGDWGSHVKTEAARSAKRLQIHKVRNAEGHWVSWPEGYGAIGQVAGCGVRASSQPRRLSFSLEAESRATQRSVYSAYLGISVTGTRGKAGFRTV